METEALTDVLVAHMLPYLNREDWNSFCSASKEISETAKKSPLLMPPWPANCTLGKYACGRPPFENPIWSPDGTQILFVNLNCNGASNSRTHIFDCKEGLLDHGVSHRNNITSMAFSPDGKFLVTACWNGFLKMWDAKDAYKLIKQWQVSCRNTDGFDVHVAVSPCSKKIAVLWCEQVQVLSIEEDTPLQSFLLDQWDSIGCNILFALDGSCLIFLCSHRPNQERYAKSGEIMVWKLKTNEVFSVPKAYATNYYGIAGIHMSPDGSKLITISQYDVNAKIWNLDVSRMDSSIVQFSRVLNTGDQAISAVFAPNGKDVLVGFGFEGDGSTKNIVTLTIEGAKRREIPTKDGFVTAIRFSPNGKQMVTAEGGSILIKTF